MASDKQSLEAVLTLIRGAGDITAKPMFGEYGIYCNEKLVALLCDNLLYVKPTEPGRAFLKHPVEAPPYPGAKACFLIRDPVKMSHVLPELIQITFHALPAPKAVARKKAGRGDVPVPVAHPRCLHDEPPPFPEIPK